MRYLVILLLFISLLVPGFSVVAQTSATEARRAELQRQLEQEEKAIQDLTLTLAEDSPFALAQVALRGEPVSARTAAALSKVTKIDVRAEVGRLNRNIVVQGDGGPIIGAAWMGL